MDQLLGTDTPTINTGHLARLLDDFRRDVPAASHLWAVASDGLLLASSSALPQEGSEKVAAAVAGFSGLAFQVDSELGGGGLELVMVEMVAGYLIIMQVSGGSRLAALTAANSDTGQTAYQLQRLADRIGEMALTVGARHG